MIILSVPFNDMTPADEEARLAALQAYHVLDSLSESGYDDITELASFICGTPIALISFIDRDRQWFKSEIGLGTKETPRSQSFCAHTIDNAETLVVSDTQADARFSSNPLVLGNPNVRFYAGAPIVEENGHVLGTVCVIDTKQRVLSAKQVAALETLARQVMVLLEQRKAIEALEKVAKEARTANVLVQTSERGLRMFVDHLPVLAWVANADGWIVWYNRRWYEYTGTTAQQMEGWGWQSVHDVEVLPSVMRRWTDSIRTGKPFEMVFPLKGADGVFRPFLTRVEPVREESGEITQWFGTNVEVDALQKTQLALEKSEAVLKQVMTATTDAVVSVNRDWVLTYLNPKAEELYGSSAQLVGRNLWEAFPDAAYEGSPFLERYHRAMNDGIAASFEAEYGDPLNFTLGLEVYPSKDGIVTFSRDITKLKHATAAVLQNEKLAAVGRLASTIAHEINNPLEAITNLLYLADHSADLEEAQTYLKAADMELRRASAITQQTLRFHRQATRPTQVSFAELTNGILVGQHSRLSNAGVHVERRDRTRDPITCLEGEMRQVLANLVVNAIDAMQGRGGTLHIRGRESRDWQTGTPGLAITIADTGIGMSESTQSKIFEAFYSTKGIGGTGLGLWISKEIVDRHHGSLRLRTRQNEICSGTVFTLFLPHAAVGPRPTIEVRPAG